MKTRSIVCLDVGEKRIGVAVADTGVRIAVAFDTVIVDGSEIERIGQIIAQENADTLVIGYPRNQLGESTAQTSFVELFAQKVENLAQTLVFQDESLTSVLAEEQLKAHKKPYTKGDIDAQAAAIILQDYLESHNG
ncbi:MAG: putative Holliday junction resolvase [Candidatus Saccharibacteria bacterium]|nr:putative Holliday junction resolvase [Candidatus Saccharibacteria bacterium]